MDGKEALNQWAQSCWTNLLDCCRCVRAGCCWWLFVHSGISGFWKTTTRPHFMASANIPAMTQMRKTDAFNGTVCDNPQFWNKALYLAKTIRRMSQECTTRWSTIIECMIPNARCSHYIGTLNTSLLHIAQHHHNNNNNNQTNNKFYGFENKITNGEPQYTHSCVACWLHTMVHTAGVASASSSRHPNCPNETSDNTKKIGSSRVREQNYPHESSSIQIMDGLIAGWFNKVMAMKLEIGWNGRNGCMH